jgi:thiol-disulfide isomerase/thioredoxin
VIGGHRRGRLRTALLVCLEFALAIAIVWSIYTWRTKDLLASDGTVQSPYFELMDLQGRVKTLKDFGDKPTVLYFFAPWCKVCNASAHQLRWFDNWLGDDVNLVMIALDFADPMEVKAFRDTHDLRADILLGNRRTAVDFRIPGYPTYYLLDSSGRIRRKDFGYTTIIGLVWRIVTGL